jgi:GntR family transcriptional regulator, transcriptional repressor for pyruvate dehydrogenase complex
MEHMRTSAAPVSAPAVGDRIVREVEREILSGRLRVGDKLPTEDTLCRRYGASRAAVREAIQRLKAGGLVVSQRGSGTYVAEKSWEQPLRRSLERYAALRGDVRAFRELLDLRILVETFCVRRLARSGAKPARERVLASLRRMEAARNDLRRFARLDMEFHYELVMGAGNELLGIIYQGLIPDLGQRFADATYTDLELTKRALRDHRAIAAALDAEDGERAVKSLEAHLQWSRKHMEEILERR